MPIFHYRARDPRGRLISDTIAFHDELALREHLRGSDLFVVEITRKRRGPRRWAVGGIGPGDVLVTVRQLRTILNAGVPLVTGLEALAAQSPNPRLAGILSLVSQAVSQGVPLADALAQHSRVFPPLLIALVRTGEEGGRLPEALGEAIRQIEQQIEIRQKIATAVVYPAFTLVATAGGVLFMILAVVPVFQRIYSDLNAELPLVTRSLVETSAFLLRYGWLGLLAGLAGGGALRRYAQTPEGRLRVDGWKLRLPLLGPLYLKAGSASLLTVVAGLIESGVPIVQALRTASSACGNELLASAARQAAGNVEMGQRLSTELEATEQFPLLVVRMVAIAEETGTLPHVLREIASSYLAEVEYSVRRLLSLIEPTMTLVVGLVVGYVLIALYYPIFQMSLLLSR